MKIGIGIATFNRIDNLQNLISDLKKYTLNSYDLFVADDNSRDGTQNWLSSNNIPFQSGPGYGISFNKNKIFQYFQNHDIIFILEDDVRIVKSGWDQLFIDALTKTKENHVSWFVKDPAYTVVKVFTFNGIQLEELKDTSAQIQVFTGKCLKNVGGFDTRFIGFGHEHTQLTERIFDSGLNKIKFSRLKNADEYFLDLGKNELKKDNPLRKSYIDLNQQTYINIRFFHNNKLETLYHPFLSLLDSPSDRIKEGVGIGFAVYPNRIHNARRFIKELMSDKRAGNIACVLAAHDAECEELLNHYQIKYFISGTNWQTLNKNILLSHLSRNKYILLLEPEISFVEKDAMDVILDFHVKSFSEFSVFQYMNEHFKPHEKQIRIKSGGKDQVFDLPDAPVMVFSGSILEKLGGFCPILHGYGFEILDYLFRASKSGIKAVYAPPEVLRELFSKKIKMKNFTYLVHPDKDILKKDIVSFMMIKDFVNRQILSQHQPLKDY